MFSNLNPRRSQATLEASKRRHLETTYTTPLGLDAVKNTNDNNNKDDDDADMHALRTFLTNFYRTFYDKSSVVQRRSLLEEYPEVSSFYKRLVKQDTGTNGIKGGSIGNDTGVLSEEEFWQRYYYRCDPNQILLEWERHPERGRLVLGQAVSSWFKKATATTVSEEIIDKKVGDAPKSSSMASESPSSSDSVSWFDAKWDSVKNAWVLPKDERDEAKMETNKVTTVGSNGSASTSSSHSNGSNKSSPSKVGGVYVPPHKRGGKVMMKVMEKSNGGQMMMGSKRAPDSRFNKSNNSKSNSISNPNNGKTNSRASGLLSGSYRSNSHKINRASNAHELKSEKTQASDEKRKAPSTMIAETLPKKHTNNHASSSIIVISTLLICCFIGTIFFLLVLSRRELICASNNPFWSPLLLCDDEPMDQVAIQVKPGRKKNKGRYTNNSGASSSSFGVDNTNNDNDFNNSGGGDSLVDNLISSWMQSTDMAQFFSGSMMNDQQHQQEQMQQPHYQQQQPYQSNNGIATLPYQKEQDKPKKKRGGPIQFLKRKFGRDRHTDDNVNSNALVVNKNNNFNNGPDGYGGYGGAISTQQAKHHQPQMVVHQHVHHVVHHVVHEYRE